MRPYFFCQSIKSTQKYPYLYLLYNIFNPPNMTSPWVHKSSYITRINATSDASGKLIEILSYDQIGVKLGFWERSETKTLVEQIPSVKRIREGRRRNAQTRFKKRLKGGNFLKKMKPF